MSQFRARGGAPPGFGVMPAHRPLGYPVQRVKMVERSGHSTGLALVACILVAGCGFDRSPLRTSIEAADVLAADAAIGAPSQSQAAGGAAPSLTQPVSGGSHSDLADAGLQPPPIVPVADAGANVAADAASSGAADAGILPTAPALPESLFAPCDADDDCGDGLVCFFGTGAGACSQPCDQDADCLDLYGFDFTCSFTESACRLLCTPGGAGRVPCPEPLSCIQGLFRTECGYPADNGSSGGDRAGAHALFEACDPALGGDDCAGDLACYRDSSLGDDGPGYCTELCNVLDNSCSDLPNDSEASLGCSSDGMCRFDCSEGSCPLGMQCESLSGRARCQYPR